MSLVVTSYAVASIGCSSACQSSIAPCVIAEAPSSSGFFLAWRDSLACSSAGHCSAVSISMGVALASCVIVPLMS